MHNSRTLALFVLPTLALAASGVLAQTARQGGGAGGGAAAAALQQVQQLASERTALQAENERLRKQLEDLKKEVGAVKSREAALGQRMRGAEASVSRVAATRESTERELNDLKGRSQELVVKFRETAQTLRDVELDRAAARQALGAREADLNACVDRNASLYRLNGELLAGMEGTSGWTRLARAEPFTQLKRIELENMADDYRSRAEEQRLRPGERPAASMPPTPAPAAAPASAPAPPPSAPETDADSATRGVTSQPSGATSQEVSR